MRGGEERQHPLTLQIEQNWLAQKKKKEKRGEKNQAEYPQHILGRHMWRQHTTSPPGMQYAPAGHRKYDNNNYDDNIG